MLPSKLAANWHDLPMTWHDLPRGVIGDQKATKWDIVENLVSINCSFIPEYYVSYVYAFVHRLL